MKFKVSKKALSFKELSRQKKLTSSRFFSRDKRFNRKYPGELPSSEWPENPEVSARLTNLSMRHATSRPSWFDFEPLKLMGRTRQCKRLFWQIADDHVNRRKHLMALVAETGMGKTSFLAELHALLEHAPVTVLTLAPGAPKNPTPYQAIRSILEQRFYIAREAPLDRIRTYVEGAVSSIVPQPQIDTVSEGLMHLWTGLSPKPEDPLISDDFDSLDTLNEITHIDIPLSGSSHELQTDSCLESALMQYFTADLNHNAFVIILDDVDKFDPESIHFLSELYKVSENQAFTLIVTASAISVIPEALIHPALDIVELLVLSDLDLMNLAHHVIENQTKGSDIQVPDEVVRLIAQRAFGSPKRAIDLIIQYVKTDGLNPWIEIVEKLRRERPPENLGNEIVNRFKSCSEHERLVLQCAAQLDADFTPSTIECIISSWPELENPETFDCVQILKQLRNKSFLAKTKSPCSQHTSYVFKHECERLIIAESASNSLRQHTYALAAQWYALNNPSRQYDETIGDLFQHCGSHLEASHYYIRKAYLLYHHADLPRAWRLFRKLLGSLPDDSHARRIQYTLDSADVAFHLGHLDEAFLLCRRASHYAITLSSYAQAARASIQMAHMLTEIGSVRHIDRYFSRAHDFLNRDMDARTSHALYLTQARNALWHQNPEAAESWLQKAKRCQNDFSPTPHEMISYELVEAKTHLFLNHPTQAIDEIHQVIQKAEQVQDKRILAEAHRMMGNLCQLSGDLPMALESWNISLGLALEMGDVIIHAKLLADIADGAFALEARRTARSASEFCLQLAQQTHQKVLIARCMLHTARLLYETGQYKKSIRLLRKAHKSAVSTKNIHYWSQTLVTIAQCYANEEFISANPKKSEKIYKNLIALLDNHKMPIHKARILTQYAGFLQQHRINVAALDAYVDASTVCYNLGLTKAYDRIKKRIDDLMKEMES